jgi:hypothetical protein
MVRTRKGRARGQTPKGLDGDRASEYPVLLVRIPKATKRQLQALSVARRLPQWMLVDQAIRALIETLEPEERHQLEQARPRRKPLRQFKDERVVIPTTCDECKGVIEIEVPHRPGFGYMNACTIECPHCRARVERLLPAEALDVRAVVAENSL